jgi:phospholipid/cholesterol/gamma-HCH transport system substrate-binding protein
MNKNAISAELKVGILVLVGIIILFYMSFRVGKYGVFREEGYEVNVSIGNASGLDIKTPVQIAGVEIGKVRRIALEGYKANATLIIKQGVKIPADSKVAVRSQGVLGDKVIEIIPGSGKTFLAQGDRIGNVIEAPDFNEIFTNVNVAAKNFGETMSDFKGLIGGSERENIKKSIENIQVMSGDFKELVKENKDGISRVVGNADEALIGLKTIVKEVESGKGTLGLLITDDKLYSDAKDVVGSMKNLTTGIEDGKGTIGKLINDETLYADAKETAKNLKDITEGIKKGEGSLGKLVNDDKLYNETEKTMKKVQRAADGVSEMTPITILGTIFGLFF